MAFDEKNDYTNEWRWRNGVQDATLEHRSPSNTRVTFCDAKAIHLDANTPGFLAIVQSLQAPVDATIWHVWPQETTQDPPDPQYDAAKPEPDDLLQVAGEDWCIGNVMEPRFGVRYTLAATKAVP